MNVAATCRNHPNVAARYTCNLCRAPICDGCARSTDTGQIICPACASPEPLETLEAVPASNTYDLAGGEPRGDYRPTIQFGNKCTFHPDAVAPFRCSKCGANLCTTCDFAFPGGIHLCPPCATDTKQTITRGRKNLAGWSIAMGILSFLMVAGSLLIIFTSSRQRNDPVVELGGCMILLVIPACLTGLILGLVSFKKGANNPGFLWIGPILNGLVVLAYLIRIATLIAGA